VHYVGGHGAPDNGILASAAGQVIAVRFRQLPDPATATAEEMCVALDAEYACLVLITYRRTLARQRKHSHWTGTGTGARCAEPAR
jgi:hypothetical protein